VSLTVVGHRVIVTAVEMRALRASLEDVDLPMAACALDAAGLRLQLERYRRAGRDAFLIERTPRRLVAELDEGVDAELVEQAIAIERECCPFFALSWDRDRRRLTVSVSQIEHEPALDAIAFALLGSGPIAEDGDLPRSLTGTEAR
jgi:hypothetical protein